jgi:hypothetical protein
MTSLQHSNLPDWRSQPDMLYALEHRTVYKLLEAMFKEMYWFGYPIN